jgi:hypothetical protein
VANSGGLIATVPSSTLTALGIATFGIFVALAYRRRWQWTGLPAAAARDNSAVEQRAKTLWDWLQLLGIPVVLATLAFLLNEAQSSRDQRREDRRTAQQRTTATDTERENTLRTYLAQMSDLMLDRRLLRSKPGADVRKVARTATLTAVRRLDGSPRGVVVQFLAEARLLDHGKEASATGRCCRVAGGRGLDELVVTAWSRVLLSGLEQLVGVVLAGRATAAGPKGQAGGAGAPKAAARPAAARSAALENVKNILT